MTGVGTVVADDPRLTVRATNIDMLGRHPLRVICDSQLRTSSTARIFKERGSIMVVLATDAPLDARQLQRLGVRATAGLARTGSHLGHGSGDFVIVFSTAHRIPHAAPTLTRTETVVIDEGRVMQWLFPAVVESVEEAVLNSLCRAETVTGRDGHIRHALPVEEVCRLVSGMGGAVRR